MSFVPGWAHHPAASRNYCHVIPSEPLPAPLTCGNAGFVGCQRGWPDELMQL